MKKRFMLPLLALLLMGFNLSARGQDSGQSDRFQLTVTKLRSLQGVTNRSVGRVGRPGKFFLLSEECLRYGTEEDFKALLRDENPVIRAMGLVCLAQRDHKMHLETLKSYTDDEGKISLILGCIISRATVGEIAKRLVERPGFLAHQPRH